MVICVVVGSLSMWGTRGNFAPRWDEGAGSIRASLLLGVLAAETACCRQIAIAVEAQNRLANELHAERGG